MWQRRFGCLPTVPINTADHQRLGPLQPSDPIRVRRHQRTAPQVVLRDRPCNNGRRIPTDSAPIVVDKGKGKAVEFNDDENDEEEEQDRPKSAAWDAEKENEFQYLARRQLDLHADSVSMSVSPRKPMSASPAVPSPLRPTSNSAPEFLRSLVRDAMYEYHQETKAEMMNLHLDLIRAGTGWKKELREIMDEYMSDLRDLREENNRLRKENEQLRRGY